MSNEQRDFSQVRQPVYCMVGFRPFKFFKGPLKRKRKKNANKLSNQQHAAKGIRK